MMNNELMMRNPDTLAGRLLIGEKRGDFPSICLLV
jgi:hypothetical protein